MLPHWQATVTRGVARLARVLQAAWRHDSCFEGGACQLDLQWWAAELRRAGHEGVPLASAGAGIASHVYADALGEGG